MRRICGTAGKTTGLFLGPTDVTGAVGVVETPSVDGLVHPGQHARAAAARSGPVASRLFVRNK